MPSNRRFLPILLLLLSTLFARADQQVYLLPKENDAALKALVSAIDHSQNEIHIAIYSFTHKAIAKALKKAAARGVTVQIVADKETNRANTRSQIGKLAAIQGIKVSLLQGKKAKGKNYHGIMHMKLAIIDQKTVIFGSANWSFSAFNTNYELLAVAKDPPLAKRLDRHLQTLFSEAEPY